MAWMRQKSDPKPKPETENRSQPSMRPTPPPPPQAETPQAKPPAPPIRREPEMQQQQPPQPQQRSATNGATVGQSVHIKGELTGKEDLTIEGSVEGRISLPDNHLTVGASARIKAEIHAKTVNILGQVHGNIDALDKVDIAPSGSVNGDIRSPRVSIADGARFKGGIDMDSGSASGKQQPNKQQNQTSDKDQPALASAS